MGVVESRLTHQRRKSRVMVRVFFRPRDSQSGEFPLHPSGINRRSCERSPTRERIDPGEQLLVEPTNGDWAAVIFRS